MRIAYLINQYPKPSHAWIRREIRALEDEGIEIDRYSIRRTEGLVDLDDQAEAKRTHVLLDAGVVGLLLAMLWAMLTRPGRFCEAAKLTVKIGRRSDRGLLRNFAYLAEACVLLRKFAEHPVQHVHAHFGTNAAAVAMLCRTLGGPPYSFTVHGPFEFDHITLLGIEEKIARAAFVSAISHFCRSQLFRWARFEDWPKIQIVRCGVDSRFLDAPATPIPDDPRLVFVGRLCAAKGPTLLVDAVARLRKQGQACRITVVGDGELRQALEQRIAELNLGEHFDLVGTASGDEVRRHIQKARAMVLPSFAEGLPVVLMESLGLGRPVISTQIAAMSELVDNGSNGWVVPPSSLDHLVDAMAEALTAPTDRLAAMGQAGAARVREQHDLRKIASRLKQLFAQSVASETAGSSDVQWALEKE